MLNRKGALAMAAALSVAAHSVAFGEVVEFDGLANAYFPDGEYIEIESLPGARHFSHADEASLTIYTLYLFEDHGESPSREWFEGFVEGQASSIKEGVSGVSQVLAQGSKVHGEFFLEGEIEGVFYDKVCRFIMNPVDYGTWCVAVLGEGSDTVPAVEAYTAYADDFELME